MRFKLFEDVEDEWGLQRGRRGRYKKQVQMFKLLDSWQLDVYV